jgi:ATP-dependent Clp protease, protease subunit
MEGAGELPDDLPVLPVLPGFREMALRRMAAERAELVRDLVARRQAAGLSQTEVAARMGTSQSAVARLEAGTTDVRASTLERYAAAIGGLIAWKAPGGDSSRRAVPGEDDAMPGSSFDMPGRGEGPPLRQRDWPAEFPRPGQPGRPAGPGAPGSPGWPGAPRWPGVPEPGVPGGPAGPGPVPGVRVWADPHADWQDQLYARLLEKRIVMASGILDEDAATRLSAQLLTLDAEGDEPIRIELQNLRAELPAALAVMGVLETLRVPVHAHASGEIHGAALGVLAACSRRLAYPNASFALSEPRLELGGTVAAVTERQQQAERMLDSLYYRIAEACGREADKVREDARRARTLTVAEAIGYGLIHDRTGKSAG